jgi:5'(3')-deoxyribonucleotidase
MTLRIGLDLDGVVYDFQGTFRYLMETHRGVVFPGETDSWWSTWHSVNEFTEKADRDWAWTEGVEDHGLFRHGNVVRGAPDGVRELSKLGEVIVVTHRPATAARDTFAFIVGQGLPIDGVLVTREPKSSFDLDVYIDDGPHVLEELTDSGKKAVVFDRPYNRGVPSTRNLRRAMGWADVPAMVKELASC